MSLERAARNYELTIGQKLLRVHWFSLAVMALYLLALVAALVVATVACASHS